MSWNNHVRGLTNAIPVAKPSANVLYAGCLVLRDSSGNIYDAASETWNTDIATTRAAATPKLLGVSMGDAVAGNTDKVLLARSGEFHFALDTGTPKVGDKVGFAKASGNAILSDTVAIVTTAGEDFGNITEVLGDGRVVVNIRPVLGRIA